MDQPTDGLVEGKKDGWTDGTTPNIDFWILYSGGCLSEKDPWKSPT